MNQSAEEALQQIKDKAYYEKYANHPLPIYLVGMGFSGKDKQIDS